MSRFTPCNCRHDCDIQRGRASLFNSLPNRHCFTFKSPSRTNPLLFRSREPAGAHINYYTSQAQIAANTIMYRLASFLVLLFLSAGARATPRRMMLSTEAATATDGLHSITATDGLHYLTATDGLHSTEAATATDGLHGLHTASTFGLCAGASAGCPMDKNYYLCWPGSVRWVSNALGPVAVTTCLGSVCHVY